MPGQGKPGPEGTDSDFTTYTDDQLQQLLKVYQANLDQKRGNASVYTRWLAQANAEIQRRADSAKLGQGPGGPPPVDFPAMKDEASIAAGLQRKRAKKNASLIEGQPDAATIASGPKATLKRKELIGY
jgi:hypothetical protein